MLDNYVCSWKEERGEKMKENQPHEPVGGDTSIHCHPEFIEVFSFTNLTPYLVHIFKLCGFCRECTQLFVL